MAPQQPKRGISLRLGLSKSGSSKQGQEKEADSRSQSLPPYDYDLSSLTGDDKEDLGGYVEICPHERLYFPRFRRISALTRLKHKDSELPALSEENPHQEHIISTVTVADDEAWKGKVVCYPTDLPDEGTFAQGQFRYTYPQWYEQFSGPYPGVLLKSMWSLWLDQFPHAPTTLAAVEDFFVAHPIFLCPHTRLVDLLAPERILRGIQIATESQDPVDTWEFEESAKFEKTCKHCHTFFRGWASFGSKGYFVSTTRLLGKGKSPKDPIWLSQ
ncbi:MAG: hypothetical protein Q9222_000492 [Ikaeria aurantiellina]